MLSAQDAQTTRTAQMRLVAAPGFNQGVYHTAVEIALAPAAITYWRQPGEAGAPPKFSFAGSENVLAANVLYPIPSRIEEDGIEVFGYRGGVVFPIHVTPQDAEKPSILKLALDYAVCETICMPASADAVIVLPHQATEAATSVVAAAEARVPLMLSPQDLVGKVMIAARPGSPKPTWTLTWNDGDEFEDLFAEAPEGWYFETHKLDKREFALVAVEMPPGAAAKPVDVRLTAVGAKKAYEFAVTLDPVNLEQH